MCKKTAISDDFENGQTPTSVRFWQELLAGEPDEALSVCRKQIEALSPSADAAELLERQRALARQSLARISHGAEAAMGSIPRTLGFFTSASDRAVSYKAICGFLELLKSRLSFLDSESLHFQGLYSILQQHRAELLRAEAMALSVQKAAKRSKNQAFAEAGEKLLQSLSRYKSEDLAILNSAKSLERLLEGFCLRTCREFCRFAAAKADLEHEGAGASPAEISRLLWGLREEAERLLKEI